MTSVPHIVHRVWIGPGYPRCYDAWWETWAEHHPGWQHITWSDTLPNSRDPRELLVGAPSWERAYLAHSRPVVRADLIKLIAMYMMGGVLTDCDAEARKSLEPLVEQAKDVVLLGPLFAYESQAPASSFAVAAPGSAFFREALSAAVRLLLTPKRRVSPARDTGPGAFRRAMRTVPGSAKVWPDPDELLVGCGGATHRQLGEKGRHTGCHSTLRDDVDISRAYVVHHASAKW